MSFMVETSARHIHLTQETVEKLFGEGYQLTKRKDLSYPGQFACNERLTVVGPKREQANVSILGPVRKADQVELSATDARNLGIDAPVRESGDVKGSGACKLVGPKGEVELTEGVIIAKRHLHITEADAAEMGVKNGAMGIKDKEIIRVACGGEGRKLIFDDVVVRVNVGGATTMHIDTDEAQAAGIAARLAEINTERQQTEQEVFAAAQKTLEADPARQRDRVLVVSGEDWHPGVIGIVAARLMEKYNRPAIVISLQNGEGRGSGRAPDPFDLHGALAGCAQYLTRFGGHAAAAGVEIEEEKLPAFRQAINAWAAEHAPRPGAPELKLDAAVQLSELTLPNVQELSRLAPFGRENPMPVLLVCDAMIDGIWPMGAEGRHTRVRLRQGNDTLFASIFGVAPSTFAYPVGTAVEAALEVSIFTGRSGPMVSAHLRAIRPAGLGNLPSEQAAWFEAFRTGGTLEPARAAALLPDRADTVMLYKRIRGGQVASGDLQPVFAAQGPENTGKTLTSLAALHELGLIQEQNGHWLPVPVTTKQDLASAPILQKLAAVVK